VGIFDNLKATTTATKRPAEIRPQQNGLKRPEPATDGEPQPFAQCARSPKEQRMLNESLHDASRLGETDRIRYLLRSGADVDARDEYGSTPMMKAAKAGQSGAVRLLRKYGADINAKDWVYTGNPLIFAVQSCDLETVRAVVELGAQVDVSIGGWTPLNTAQFLEFCKKRRFGIAEYLERHVAG